MIYGNKVSTERTVRRDVIGEVTKASAGNLVIRVGYEGDDGEHWIGGAAHVVLTPEEVRAFVNEVIVTMGWNPSQLL